MPDKPYTVSVMQMVVKQFDAAIRTLAGEQAASIPPLAWNPPDKRPKWVAPLPLELWQPLYVLFGVMVPQMGAVAAKYAMDPMTLVNDGSLRMAGGYLAMMAKDKKLAKAVQGPTPDENAPAVAPPSGEETETDREMMGAM